MLKRALALAEAAYSAPDGASAAFALFEAAQPYGASFIKARHYRRPEVLTSHSHWTAGGVIAERFSPGWAGSAASHYVWFECNPLLAPVRDRRTRWRFSDVVPFTDRDHYDWWDAYGEAGIADAQCAAIHASGDEIATIHLGFNNRKLDGAEKQAIDLALTLVVERVRSLAPLLPTEEPNLTQRERDCMAFVAAGKTDWEISIILGVSERTVRFHVENARAKLDAVNRTQAVARLVSRGLI